jgi:acetoacetate decarboxylase
MPSDASAAAPKINPGDIAGWPILKIEYRTDPKCIAALLPPGISPSSSPTVYLSVYNVPVPDEPEYGVVVGVAADHKGLQGRYTLGYGIDQESAIFISRDMNGQPKYPCKTTYYRMGNDVTARASHQGYTFLEFRGAVKGAVATPPDHVEHEWWIKVSRAVGGAEKSYDFPPHVVHVKSTYRTAYQETVDGALTLRESPWDPIAKLLPMRELVTAYLWTPVFLGREITLGAALDPDAFWPHVDTIGGSRWPGHMGGPRRS